MNIFCHLFSMTSWMYAWSLYKHYALVFTGPITTEWQKHCVTLDPWKIGPCTVRRRPFATKTSQETPEIFFLRKLCHRTQLLLLQLSNLVMLPVTSRTVMQCDWIICCQSENCQLPGSETTLIPKDKNYIFDFCLLRCSVMNEMTAVLWEPTVWKELSDHLIIPVAKL